jgi:hypothetical protein
MIAITTSSSIRVNPRRPDENLGEVMKSQPFLLGEETGVFG